VLSRGLLAAGHFAENLAVDPTGAVYVSLHSHNLIDRYDPKTRKVGEYARLTARRRGHAFDAAGSLWVAGGASSSRSRRSQERR